MSKYRFLILEDNDLYFETIRMIASNFKGYRIEFLHASNLDEAKELYETHNARIQGIILDVLGNKKPSQITPDEACFVAAREYFIRNAEHLPIVALTGHPGMVDNVKKWWAGAIEVYSKGDQEEDMLNYLIGAAKKLPTTKIIKKYQDVFEVVEKYLDNKAFGILFECIRDMENPGAIAGIVTKIRQLQEYLYIGLHNIDPAMVPKDFIYNGEQVSVNNQKIISHLRGNYDKDSKSNKTKVYIEYGKKHDLLLNYIYKTCSEEIHVGGEDTTKYTVQSLVYAFMDLVLWLNNIQNNREKTKSTRKE